MFIFFSNDNKKLKQIDQSFDQDQYVCASEIQKNCLLVNINEFTKNEINKQNIINKCQKQAQEKHLQIIQFLYYPNILNSDFCQVWTDCQAIISDLFSSINMISIIYDKNNRNKFEKFDQFKNQKFIQFDKSFHFLDQFLNISDDINKRFFDKREIQQLINLDDCNNTQKSQINLKQENKNNKIIYQQSIEQSNLNKALLIGLEHVGKSIIFNKVEGRDLIKEGDFNYKFVQDQFILVDCPSFSTFRDATTRDNLIEKYTIFLEKNITSISKFFLVLKYDRIDIIKGQFSEMMKYFKPFLQQIKVIINYQSDCEASSELQQIVNRQERNDNVNKDILEIQRYICAVTKQEDINIHVFKMNIEQDELRSWFKSAQQSEFQKISLHKTMFERIAVVELKNNLQAISDQINKVYDQKGFNNQVKDNLNGQNNINENIKRSDYYNNNQSNQNCSGSKNMKDQNQLGEQLKKILNLFEEVQIQAENSISEQQKKESSQALFKIMQIVSNIGQKINS